MTDGQNQLRNIKTFEELIRYLEDELDWPLSEFGFEDLTFEYSPSELGLKEEDAAKVRTIHQLRPLVDNQPWGIFFVEFENKRMPVVVLRRILSHLIVKKRVSSEKAYSASWHQGDLLFISAFGDEYSDQREIAFAHFHQEDGDLPTLRVLGWDGADTFLKLDHVVATLKERLCWPGDPSDSNAWRQQWSLAFRHRIGHVIRTADALAERLAELARGIRGAATTIMEHESENGALRRLHKAFQIALIHDLGEADFADTYAQTITYGLLTAAISRTEMSEGSEGTTLFAENVTDMVPITNPFLREMLQTFLQAGGRKGGIDFDELGIQNVVELLRGDETDLPAILRDFGNRTRGEDPVIHFYEHFLRAYDNELKIQRGVFYTPKPVVSYIVRSVHELLQTDFGLEDGLASTVTWAEIQEREADIRLPEGVSPDSPFVQILDPATGTATFLVEVIDIIHQTLVKKWIQKGFNEKQQQVAWNEYVVNHLLRCLHGYELMMAPYAIAHMKIGLKLYETGYRFGSDERVRIYLTNSLEPPLVEKQQLSFAEWAPALAHEAQSVNEIKRKQNYTIIIGNPPYSNYGMTNTGNWILNLIADYKKDINEKKINLNDDFIKFIRFGQYLLDQTGSGIFAMITNNSFLDGISHKEMRNSLANSYSSLNVLNLHGNLKRMEKTPEGNLDKNVFEIQPGVAISIFVKNPSHDIKPSVYYEDMWGDRDNKYKLLMRSTVNSNNWKKVELIPDRFFFIPKDFSNILEYEGYSKIDDIFIISQNGLKTDRDLLFYDDQKEKLEERVKQFYSDDGLSDEFRDLYNIHNSSSYDLVDRRDNTNYQADNIYKCLYRPFDIRWLYYSLGLTSRPASNAMKQMIANKNIAIVTGRAGQFIGSEEWDLVFCSEGLVDTNLFRRGGNLVLPLFTYKVNEESSNGQMKLEITSHTKTDEIYRVPNLSCDFISTIEQTLGLTFVPENFGNFINTIGPYDIHHYIYSVLHSKNYRELYKEYLMIDFPRIPITSNKQLFERLSAFGADLISFHILDSQYFAASWVRENKNRPIEEPFPEFVLNNAHSTIGKLSKNKCYQSGRISIDTSLDKKSSYFDGIPENVWNFHIGGYQILHKWLYDRRGKSGKPGRTLTPDDIDHYQRIVVALNETIRIMDEIDEVIEEHGGWPIQ